MPYHKLQQPDKLIHEPARLAIVTVLSSCKTADFLFLQRITGLTKGNLSVQLSKLEEAELVRITKKFVDKKPSTSASLTEKGCQALADYWTTMDQIRKQAETPSLSERTASGDGADRPDRQHDNGMDQFEHAAHRDTDDAER